MRPVGVRVRRRTGRRGTAGTGARTRSTGSSSSRSPSSPGRSGIGDTGFHPVVWYRRSVHRDAPGPGSGVLLHFGAVDYRAHVWVNGHAVAFHEGGHTPFTADITSALDPSGADQVVVVRAEDSPTDLRQPRGKQDWQPEPHAIWYDRTTGIWQPVWLEHVPATAHPLAALEPRTSDERGVDLDGAGPHRGRAGPAAAGPAAPARPGAGRRHLRGRPRRGAAPDHRSPRTT